MSVTIDGTDAAPKGWPEARYGIVDSDVRPIARAVQASFAFGYLGRNFRNRCIGSPCYNAQVIPTGYLVRGGLTAISARVADSSNFSFRASFAMMCTDRMHSCAHKCHVPKWCVADWLFVQQTSWSFRFSENLLIDGVGILIGRMRVSRFLL